MPGHAECRVELVCDDDGLGADADGLCRVVGGAASVDSDDAGVWW